MYNVTQDVRKFNNWLEPFLIEMAMPLMIIGFITGTIDLLTGGTIARLSIFEYIWATVQSIAIDGLFFSVWLQVRRAKWATFRQCLRAIALIVIGLALGFVAMMVNDILSLQQVTNVASTVAMQNLHIDPVAFTHIRAVLVVVVAILVALVREDAIDRSPQPIAQTQTEVAMQPVARSPKRSPRTKVVEATQSAISEHASIDHSLEEIARETEDSPEDAGYVASDDGATIAIAIGDSPAIIATGSHRDRIRKAMQEAMQSGLPLNYREIAEAAQVGYSTVKKWAPEIKQELEQ